MIPEIGQLALTLALFLALAQTVFPLVGAATGRAPWMGVAVPAAAGQFTFVVLAFGCLAASFLGNDFSVLNVATNSNSKLPDFFRFAAVWGSHEGSLLLWALILATWTVAVCARQRELPPVLAARMLGVMGAISVGFLAFILFTSNPFERLDMIPVDGNDLNPLLQDVAMIAHPPMLYMGYVGFVVAFAYAVAALLTGRVERDWVRWIRPWTTTAWLFLTVGIALGSWWAYYELGWGGWWFWDPVENASFMPWLVGTALIHSLAVTEKRGIFLGTTLLLAITAFSLSLVGTFLVRSGVLVSVHAFASDPTRGLFILAFLGVVIGTALGLYAWRAPSLDQPRGFKPLSRETFLLVNNLLLCVAAGLVFLGTVYPLVLDALNQGKISVGPPYFETAFIIPMLPLVFAVGVGMHTAWRSADAGSLWRKLRWLAVVAVIAGIAVPTVVYGGNSALTAAGVAAGLWLVLSALADPVRAILKRGPAVTRSALGMNVAHLGLGLFVLGVTVTSSFTIETDQKISPGGTATVGDYTIRFDSLREVQGPNYQALQGTMTIQRGDRIVATVYPEKRAYFVRSQPMTEAGIDGTIGRDLFVALGDDLGAGAWSVRIQYKPLIRFIWLGCLIMAAGGLLAATDRRYRFAREREPAAPASGELATGAAGS
jgi:cytochrome c-type biogenesis protein CcmF